MTLERAGGRNVSANFCGPDLSQTDGRSSASAVATLALVRGQVLGAVAERFPETKMKFEHAYAGGAGYDRYGTALPLSL